MSPKLNWGEDKSEVGCVCVVGWLPVVVVAVAVPLESNLVSKVLNGSFSFVLVVVDDDVIMSLL